MLSYKKSIEMLSDCTKIVLASNTRLQKNGNNIEIVLHGTAIITMRPDGSITLNSGGYLTKTTKERINKYSPFKVTQHSYKWYVNGMEFVDGITFNAKGKAIEMGWDANEEEMSECA